MRPEDTGRRRNNGFRSGREPTLKEEEFRTTSQQGVDDVNGVTRPGLEHPERGPHGRGATSKDPGAAVTADPAQPGLGRRDPEFRPLRRVSDVGGHPPSTESPRYREGFAMPSPQGARGDDMGEPPRRNPRMKLNSSEPRGNQICGCSRELRR